MKLRENMYSADLLTKLKEGTRIVCSSYEPGRGATRFRKSMGMWYLSSEESPYAYPVSVIFFTWDIVEVEKHA